MEAPTMSREGESQAIAVLGGTFDPVHNGHLRLAIELAEKLNLHQVRLMPGYLPVHKDSPSASTEQRLQMLSLAVADSPELTVDDREIKRQGPSYTLLSLQELRKEVGEDCPIYFILGEDAFSKFDEWHQWRELIRYAHLLVAIRPGIHADISPELEQFVEANQYRGEGIPTSAAGYVIRMSNVMLEISSSDIRQRIAENRNIRYLLPANVHRYIAEQQIYQKP